MAGSGRPSRIGWELPPFYCPFDRGLVHSGSADLERRAVEWIDAFGIYPSAVERAWGLATRSADFSCRIIPFGDAESLLLFIEWNYWANAVDDWQDSPDSPPGAVCVLDHGVRLALTLEAPEISVLPRGPMVAALDDLVARTRAHLTPVQMRRFCEGARDWLLGASWQAANSERGVMPSLNDHTTMGALANGTRFSLAWSDVANGINLSEEIRQWAPVLAVTEAAGFIVSADNDLFSYNKDDHQEPWEQNLANVLAHQDSCSPREAMPKAVALRDRVMTLFIRVCEQLASHPDEQLHRYLDSLKHYITGSIEWQNLAPRYASPRNRHHLPVEGATFDITWRNTASDPSHEPPSVPSLARWWNCLKQFPEDGQPEPSISPTTEHT